MWDGICAASKAAVAAAALPASAYKSVGFSSQRGTILMLDENKNNLMPSIVWNDGRALKYQEEFGKEISPEDYQTHTGMQLSPLWSAAKIAWLRDNDPDVFRRTRWFANGQEYFLHRMGADEWVTDPASLTLNGMMEIGKLDWSDRILALCGIDRDRVPPVGIPSGQAGTLSATAAAETGLPAGIPICRGAGDQQCAAIGAGVVHQGAGRVHRRHRRRHGRPPRQPGPHPGPQPVVGRPRRARRLGHRGRRVRARRLAEVVARQPRRHRADRRRHASARASTR